MSGNKRSKFIDLTKKKFGKLIVVNRVANDKWGHIIYLCQCDCGKQIIVRSSCLKNKNTQSCGCLRKELAAQRSTKHGHCMGGKESKVYHVWTSMIARCTNSNHIDYHNWGGRGITVCEQWLKFENFNADMGKSWKLGLTIERIKNEKGYYLDNCKWATRKEQNRNKQKNRYEEYDGKIWLFVELCEKYNVPYDVVYKRFYKYGWTLKKIINNTCQTVQKGTS